MMEDVVAAARQIKKILEEQTDTKMQRLLSTVQNQIRLLKKHLKEANEQIAAHRAMALPVAAMAAVPAPTTATAAAVQPPPATPLTTSTRVTARSLHSTALPAVRWIDNPHAASSARKRATSCPTVLPDRSFNAFFASKYASARGPPRGQILELPPQEDDSHSNPKVQLNC